MRRRKSKPRHPYPPRPNRYPTSEAPTRNQSFMRRRKSKPPQKHHPAHPPRQTATPQAKPAPRTKGSREDGNPNPRKKTAPLTHLAKPLPRKRSAQQKPKVHAKTEIQTPPKNRPAHPPRQTATPQAKPAPRTKGSCEDGNPNPAKKPPRSPTSPNRDPASEARSRNQRFMRRREGKLVLPLTRSYGPKSMTMTTPPVSWPQVQ